MKPLSEVLSGVRTAEQAAAQAREVAKANLEQVHSEATDVLKGAQTAIAEGRDTTGNKFYDGLIVVYGDKLASGTIVKNYEKVAEELKGKRGQPVVLVHKWSEIEGCTGFGGTGTEVIQTSITVGKLGGTKFKFDYENKQCILPTSKYAQSRGHLSREQQMVVVGGLEVSNSSFRWREFDLGADLNRPIPLERQDPFAGGSKVPTLSMAVGHDSIAEWLSGRLDRGEVDIFQDANEIIAIRDLCRALAVDPIEPATHYQRIRIEDYESSLEVAAYRY